ncbi:MAG: IPTL-CTERM sorting domain-containing protein [Saprospiraceae bacterium]|nr:IPTL-CTERM sorting domain-containing protein [Saprospiraceae bacterium]
MKRSLLFFAILLGISASLISQDFAIIHYHRCDGNYGDYSSADFNDFWGVHVWTGAENPTMWPDPVKAIAFDDYGAIFEIPLVDGATELAFIIHRGDTKDIGPDQMYDLSNGYETWVISGEESAGQYIHYPSFSLATGSQNYCGPPAMATIHYLRCAGDYGDYTSNDFNNFWGLHVWTGSATPTSWPDPIKASGIDAFGAFFEVPLLPGVTELAFIIHRGDLKDPGGDEMLNIEMNGQDLWIISGDNNGLINNQYYSMADAISSPYYCGELSVATIHYSRCDRDFGNFNSNDFNNYWGIHVWTGALNPTMWQEPIKPIGEDDFGLIYEVPLMSMATELNFIIHKGDEKDPAPDQSLDLVNTGNEVWLISGDYEVSGFVQYISLFAATNSALYCGFAIPTLSQWGFIILALLLVVVSVAGIRQNKLVHLK